MIVKRNEISCLLGVILQSIDNPTKFDLNEAAHDFMQKLKPVLLDLLNNKMEKITFSFAEERNEGPEDKLASWFAPYFNFKILQNWVTENDVNHYVVFDKEETIYFIRVFKVGKKYELKQDRAITIGRIRND